MSKEWSELPPEGQDMLARLISARYYYEDCAARAQWLLDHEADPDQVDEAFEIADWAQRELEAVRRIAEHWQRQLCDVDDPWASVEGGFDD